MSRKLQVHKLLSREELDELEEFARQPGRTIDDCLNWMVERDFAISRDAVFNWKREFDSTDKFRAASDAARAVLAASGEKDAVQLSAAAAEQLGQLLFEKFLAMQMQGEVETKEIWAMSMAWKNLVMGKRHEEKLKKEIAETNRKAVEEASKVAQSGGGNEAVIAKVREILGVA